MEKVPSDLQKVLTANTEAHALWKDLTPIARRDFMSWIASAKQPETRKRRIESIPSRLLSGKRRPCCYAIVPMNFYKALNASPKAKAQWKDLTPTERRDFVDWVESAKEPDERRQRVEKACLMLATGKRCP
jgi:uncharacterized protein YdeI (YjbR/CyaY-like superfamily)